MSVTSYYGLPGSGKSYTVFENVIIPALKDGREVWTNIPIHQDELKADNIPLPILFDLQDIKDNSDWFFDVFNKGAILVLDEVQLLWPAGLKQNNVNPRHIEFFTKHRHMVGSDGKSTQICLLTQKPSLIAKFARSLSEKSHVTTNLEFLGKPKSYRVDIYVGEISDKPSQTNKIRETYGSYKPEIYKYYISHTDSEYGAGDETRSDKRGNILRGFRAKYLMVSIVLFPILAVIFGRYFINKFDEKIHPEKEVISQPIVNKNSNLIKLPSSNSLNTNQSRMKKNHLLADADIYIAISLQRNDIIHYTFNVSRSKDEAIIQDDQLKKLGYKINSITPCLVKIYQDDYENYIYCRSGPSQSVISNVVAPNQTF